MSIYYVKLLKNGKLKIAEYCLSNLDISNIKLQEILDNAEVATWADLKDWKILIDLLKKKLPYWIYYILLIMIMKKFYLT